MSFVPAHTTVKRSQNHADPPCCRRQVRSLVDPRAGGLRDEIDEGLRTFWNVVEHMQHAADRRQPIHQVEETIFRDLLVIGNWLLQAFLDMAGTGDVGPTLRVASDSPLDPDQNLPRLEQPHRRPYLSIFGEVAIERTCYGQDRVEAAPLDAQLHLPQRQYSYLLQQWLGRSSSMMLTPRRSASWGRFSAWRSP